MNSLRITFVAVVMVAFSAFARTDANESPDSGVVISSGGRAAVLISVGVALPVVAGGIGALLGLQGCSHQSASTFGPSMDWCGFFTLFGGIVGAVAGIVLTPLALLVTDQLLPAPSGGGGTIAGGLLGLVVGLGAGAALIAWGLWAGNNRWALWTLGGVVAIGAPIAGALIGMKLHQRSSAPGVGLVPLPGGAALSFSGHF